VWKSAAQTSSRNGAPRDDIGERDIQSRRWSALFDCRQSHLARAWLEAVDPYADSLARVLVEVSKRPLSGPAAKVIGLAIVSLFAAILDAVGRGAKEGSNNRAVVKGLRPQIDDAIDRIAPVLNSLGR
jgi:hypothetical protein